MKLAIIHFLPLEYYPPVTNLLDYLVNYPSNKFEKIKVFSTTNNKKRKNYQFPIQLPHKSIRRTPFPNEKNNSISRIIKYLKFNLQTLILLTFLKPDKILYFESYSAWPVYVYARYINRKVRIFIHNHEYSSKDWYQNTMKQVRYFHKLERKWLYPKAVWNSQTNPDRLDFFHRDHPYLNKEQLRVMPNYPPKTWQTSTKKKINTKDSSPLKLVYVGSLSFQSTYLKEVCEWIIKQNGKIHLDIFSFNLYDDVKSYLSNLSYEFINFHEKGIEYNDIPNILPEYDVGLIFYKAYSRNVTNCVSNKFYEYVALGLDVWFSQVMTTTNQHTNINSFPKVIPVDFENLDKFDWKSAASHEGLQHKPTNFFCEDIYEELVDKIIV